MLPRPFSYRNSLTLLHYAVSYAVGGIATVFYLFEVAFLANARTRRFEFPAPRPRDSTSVIRNLVFFCVLNS